MKKVFTIIVALMLSSIGLYAFEKVQLEKFQTLQINELKKGPSLKKAKLSFNQPKAPAVKANNQKVTKHLSKAQRAQLHQQVANVARAPKKAAQAEALTISASEVDDSYVAADGEWDIYLYTNIGGVDVIVGLYGYNETLEGTYDWATNMNEYSCVFDAASMGWNFYEEFTACNFTVTSLGDNKYSCAGSFSIASGDFTFSTTLSYTPHVPQTYTLTASNFTDDSYYGRMVNFTTEIGYFSFLINAEELESGKTYGWDDMDHTSTLSCYSEDGYYVTSGYTDADLTKTVAEDGSFTVVAHATLTNGDQVTINYVYEKPDLNEISVVVTDATLTNRTVAGYWTIGGKNADKTQDINLYFKSKGLQGIFTEKEMYDYNTWLDDSSTGSKVTYENLSAANLVSTIVADSLVIEGTLALSTSAGAPANVIVHISTPFKQEWGEWADFAPFDKNTGKYVLSSFFTSPQTQRNIPVMERKDNTGMKQYKLSGWGAGLLTIDGIDLIINRDANNNLIVPEVYTGAKTSGFEVWTTDAYSFSGGAEAQGKYDPETGVFKMNMVSFLPEYDDYNWGASEESLTMDQVISKRDTVDIVSTKLGYNDSYLESDKLVIYYDQSIEGYQVFRVTSNNATSVDGTFKWSEGGINNANSYFQLTGSSTKNYFQDGEFTVVTEGKNIALKGWMIGDDEKYYRLDMSYVAPTKRDTVSFSGKGIAISKVTDDTTGEHTGWFYEFGADGYEFLLQSTVPAEKFGTFSYEDKTLGKQYYNVFDPEGGRQQFKEGSITVAEVGDSIFLDGQLIAEDEKVYILHFAKSTIKDTIKVEVASYDNIYFASDSDVYYELNAPNYTFYYDIYVSSELKDAENGVEYTLDNMYAKYCEVVDSINGVSLPMEEASFIKNEKDSLLYIDAKAVTDDAVYIISYVGKKKVVEPKKDFAIDFAVEELTIDDSMVESYGDILIDVADAAGNGISLDIYDSKYADGVITPGVYVINDSFEDGTAYPGSLFFGILPLPCYAYDANGNYWFFASGTITVTANSIVIDAVDDEGVSVKSTITLSPESGIGSVKAYENNKVTKFFDGKKIVIRKGDKNYNVNGLEF